MKILLKSEFNSQLKLLMCIWISTRFVYLWLEFFEKKKRKVVNFLRLYNVTTDILLP